MQGYSKSLVGRLYASLLDAVLLFERPASSLINTEPAYQPTDFNWKETNSFVQQHHPFQMAHCGSHVSYICHLPFAGVCARLWAWLQIRIQHTWTNAERCNVLPILWRTFAPEYPLYS
jgi:hypothetical protein